jgi:DNA repair exonuclease SbcCD ATPase subunit
MAASGLTNTGFSESSQVSMYNQYQTRVATARDVFNRAILNYDNSIKEAQLANNSKLAEIAYQALQTQLELSLAGFQYKNTLLQTQLEMQQQTEDRYYSRWQDVLNQMNQENQFAESIRQYEQDYKFQQEQFAEQKTQFEKEYTFKIQQFDESIRQFDEEMARLKKKDAEEYALEIQKIEMQKKQAETQKAQWEKEYQLKQKQMEQEQKNWEKEYALAKKKSSSSSNGGGSPTVKYVDGGDKKDNETSSNYDDIYTKISKQKPKQGTLSSLGYRLVLNSWKDTSKAFLQEQYKNGKLTKSEVTQMYTKLGL